MLIDQIDFVVYALALLNCHCIPITLKRVIDLAEDRNQTAVNRASRDCIELLHSRYCTSGCPLLAVSTSFQSLSFSYSFANERPKLDTDLTRCKQGMR